MLQVGKTALFTACKKGYDEVVEMLLNYGAQVNRQSSVRYSY